MPRSPKAPDPSLAKRFLYYLDTVFRGNQSVMAERLGCSQAVISKIKTGRQPPGQQLLSALARHPKINPAWLLTGEGEPLLAAPDDDGGWPVPISRHILPGPLDHHRRELPGHSIPVAGSLFQGSRYFLEISVGMPVIAQADEQFKPGDLLLIETEVAGWLHAPASLAGKLVSVWDAEKRQVMLGRATYQSATTENPPALSVRAYGPNNVSCRVPVPKMPDADAEAKDQSVGKLRRRVQVDAAVNAGTGEDLVEVELIGVAMFLWRGL